MSLSALEEWLNSTKLQCTLELIESSAEWGGWGPCDFFTWQWPAADCREENSKGLPTCHTQYYP